MWFTRVSLNNPVFAAMLMLALMVLGLVSLQRLQVDLFPEIDLPVVVVVTDYPGASPPIVASEVSRKLEEGLNSIAGINSLSSRNYEGTSVVVLEFNLDVDVHQAAEDVRERIALIKPSLRSEVGEPRVQRFNPSTRPIWSLAVLPDAAAAKAAGVATPTPLELSAWADTVLKRRLENVLGVGAVTTIGGQTRTIHVRLQLERLQALGISADQVNNAIVSENQDLALGNIRSSQTDQVLQIVARLQDYADLGQITVARRDGVAIKLKDVARIVDGPDEIESLALYNGQEALVLTVQKTQDGNTIAVVDGLQKVLAAMTAPHAAQVPAGVRLAFIADSSRPIRVAVKNVTHTLIEGAILTVLVILLYLNSWRSTVITGLTLPVTIVGTCFFIYLLGFTINMVTLMALSLAVGFLIDDAIVVRENIVRHVQMGKSPMRAALEGTQEIGLAVLTTTLAIVAVFLPIGFMGGIIGRFFHQFGLTIVVAILISMFVSFTLDPMLSSVWHDPAIARELALRTGATVENRSWYDRSIGRLSDWFIRQNASLGRAYQRILARSLAYRKTTLLLALGSMVAGLLLLHFVGTEFMPRADFSEIYLTFNTPVGSSLELTAERARQVERIARSLPEVRYTLATINGGTAGSKNTASMYIRMVDRSERSADINAIIQQLRQRLLSVPGITITQAGLSEIVSGSKQIELSLRGPDNQQVEAIARRVLQQLPSIAGIVDLDSSLKEPKPIHALQIQRDLAAALGLNVHSIGQQLRKLISGTQVGTWLAPDERTWNIKTSLEPAVRNNPELLSRLPIVATAADGSPTIVPLNVVATLVPSVTPTEIKRRALMREVSISANTQGRSAGAVSADMRQVLNTIAWPAGYSFEFMGSTKNMQESFSYAAQALLLAISFMYMILASQFKSFIQPIAIMSSLPLTLIGVVLSLLIFRSNVSMFTVIGIIMLMGLVTKNAILLIDYALRQRALGMAREAALMEAARVRLRPILMTSVTMVFGMMPLAFALTEGSEQRAPMGQAIIGGVITSSILTLVVVPVTYCVLDDVLVWWKKWRAHQSAQL